MVFPHCPFTGGGETVSHCVRAQLVLEQPGVGPGAAVMPFLACANLRSTPSERGWIAGCAHPDGPPVRERRGGPPPDGRTEVSDGGAALGGPAQDAAGDVDRLGVAVGPQPFHSAGAART